MIKSDFIFFYLEGKHSRKCLTNFKIWLLTIASHSQGTQLLVDGGKQSFVMYYYSVCVTHSKCRCDSTVLNTLGMKLVVFNWHLHVRPQEMVVLQITVYSVPSTHRLIVLLL